jgi:hypothetical protein
VDLQEHLEQQVLPVHRVHQGSTETDTKQHLQTTLL